MPETKKKKDNLMKNYNLFKLSKNTYLLDNIFITKYLFDVQIFVLAWSSSSDVGRLINEIFVPDIVC